MAHHPVIYFNQPNPTFFRRNYSFNPDNVRTINDFYDKIFYHYSKVMPVRVDFCLMKTYEERYDYLELRGLFNRLLNNRHKNSLFKHCISYLSRLEYANDSGWHIHALFLFDGQKVQNDYAYADAICRYWRETVTKDKGRAYSRNMDREFIYSAEEERQALGGYINHWDMMRINALMQYSYYLAKQTAADREKKQILAPHARFFNTGQIKLDGSNKRGRKRNKVEYAENPELSSMMQSMHFNGTRW